LNCDKNEMTIRCNQWKVKLFRRFDLFNFVFERSFNHPLFKMLFLVEKRLEIH